ncbi:MAG TPA: hypothetical protein VG675_24970 [Bryobacteraceae bacterium]|nr:hypothetical protein [Bryobacteraceae bacterium]
MAQAEVNSQFEQARAEVVRACELLVCPSVEALDRCTGLLEGAVTTLSAARSKIPELRGNSETMAEARRLQVAIGRARVLLNSASEFHMGWSRILSGIVAGYTAGGNPASMPQTTRISVRG